MLHSFGSQFVDTAVECGSVVAGTHSRAKEVTLLISRHPKDRCRVYATTQELITVCIVDRRLAEGD